MSDERQIPDDLAGRWIWAGDCLRRVDWPMYLAPSRADLYDLARRCEAYEAQQQAQRAQRGTRQRRPARRRQIEQVAREVERELLDLDV